jgi:hypothetical protein
MGRRNTKRRTKNRKKVMRGGGINEGKLKGLILEIIHVIRPMAYITKRVAEAEPFWGKGLPVATESLPQKVVWIDQALAKLERLAPDDGQTSSTLKID